MRNATAGLLGVLAPILVLAAGCSKGTDPAITGLGPEPWSLPGEDTGNDPPASTTSGGTDGDDTGNGSTGAAEVTGADSLTDGPVDPETTTGADDAPGTFGGDMGEQPATGWWAHCTPNTGACQAGLVCLSTDAGEDGVCTAECAPAGDPTNCGASPGGTNMPVCLSVGGDSVCALGCDGGLTCPNGMICHTDSDDNGPIAICI